MDVKHTTTYETSLGDRGPLVRDRSPQAHADRAKGTLYEVTRVTVTWYDDGGSWDGHGPYFDVEGYRVNKDGSRPDRVAYLVSVPSWDVESVDA